MSNVTVNIVVEGPSERNFLQSVVAPQLGVSGVFILPSVVGNSDHKGGNIKFERVLTDIENYLKQRPDTLVSTMVDYFRLDSDWPGMAAIKQRLDSGESISLSEKAEVLQKATLKAVQAKLQGVANLESRFVPYIQMHEFEALLFSDGEVLAEKMGISPSRIQAVITEYDTPEHINTDPAKAPSKRIEALAGRYKKVRQSLPIAQAIGLHKIRQECQLFNEWLQSFEASVEVVG
ncbi:MAG: DUF4276 family protein [Thiotrichales bacterium]|nr:DUF4276 family protein [Thiotrichales bacterium]